jgi:hypothetical protein
VGEILMSAEEIMAELRLHGREGSKPESHAARFYEWRKRNNFPGPAAEGDHGELLWLREDFVNWARKNKPVLKEKRKSRVAKGAEGTSLPQLREALKAEGELGEEPRPARVRLDE